VLDRPRRRAAAARGRSTPCASPPTGSGGRRAGRRGARSPGDPAA
jgi:hypothetical protein